MLQFLPIPICGRLRLKADQMIVAYMSLAPQSRSTDLIQHVARLGFCTYILGYLWTALFKSGSNLQRVQHVARSSVHIRRSVLHLSVSICTFTALISSSNSHLTAVLPISSVPTSLFEIGSIGLIQHVTGSGV